jgi:hypothetical protein
MATIGAHRSLSGRAGGTRRCLHWSRKCCETAGFSCVYETNLSMNVFQLWGIAFIPNTRKLDMHRESDAMMTY